MWLLLIGQCSEEGIEDEGFCLFLIVTLVRKYHKAKGMKVNQPPVCSLGARFAVTAVLP